MSQNDNPRFKTLGYTLLALIAFAANSVLCRLALKDGEIDAASFTSLRLVSGVLMFVILALVLNKREQVQRSQTNVWLSALFLFVYAAGFSFAYLSLDTGTGALVLFGAVQITMIIVSMFRGHKLRLIELLGIGISFSGLTYLVYPELSTPSMIGFVLMTLAGVAWGSYTLLGRGSKRSFEDSALNFKYTLPFVLVLAVVTYSSIQISIMGAMLAIASGALASALGYTIWYQALRGLTATEAAVVQLSVPVIAAIGGVVFVAEAMSMRLVIACGLVLGGILLVVLNKRST